MDGAEASARRAPANRRWHIRQVHRRRRPNRRKTTRSDSLGGLLPETREATRNLPVSCHANSVKEACIDASIHAPGPDCSAQRSPLLPLTQTQRCRDGAETNLNRSSSIKLLAKTPCANPLTLTARSRLY